MEKESVTDILLKYHDEFYKIVPFNSVEDKLLLLDFTENNKELTHEVLNDTGIFSSYITDKIREANCKYGIGGYAEHRTIYNRSNHFDPLNKSEEPRRLHLGIDIWGPANTAVAAPLDGIIHSFAFNNNYGDYGATIILTHTLEETIFHTLYGHLSLQSLKSIAEGDEIKQGDVFAEFGIPADNGHWPPHLHFQVIINMQEMKGDYPGVCRFSEKEIYLRNCPDPETILGMMKYVE